MVIPVIAGDEWFRLDTAVHHPIFRCTRFEACSPFFVPFCSAHGGRNPYPVETACPISGREHKPNPNSSHAPSRAYSYRSALDSVLLPARLKTANRELGESELLAL